MKVFSICANFSRRNIADSATLHLGYALTGARSAPDKNLRVLRASYENTALRGHGYYPHPFPLPQAGEGEKSMNHFVVSTSPLVAA
jgi:hypothetical protein